MNDPRKVIIEPVVTEKSTELIERPNKQGEPENAYTFKVAKKARKPEIGQAVEAIFNVKVKSVRTLWRRGKVRRGRRGGTSHTPDWKKAVVTLQPGHRIELH
jgi:large subunit ribosomal protein L23